MVHHKHVTFAGTKREAERELARLSFELESKPRQEVETGLRWNIKTTFNDTLSAWKENGWQDLSPKTVRDDEGLIRLHIKVAQFVASVRMLRRHLPYDWREKAIPYVSSLPCCQLDQA